MVSTLLIAVLAGLLGLAFCFAGYRFFLVMLPIWGFFAGFWIGAMGTSMLLGGGFLGTTITLVVGVVVGIIAAILSYFFYMAGVVLVSAAFGGMLASAIMGALGFDPGLITTIVIIISAIVAAGLTLLLNLQKLVIIVFTAIAGAALIVVGVMVLFGQITPAELQAGGGFLRPIFEGSWLWGLVALALAAAGVVVQFRTSWTYTFTKDEYVEGWG
jgi:hypothetical protein